MAKLSPMMIAPPVIFAAFVALAAVGMYRDDPEGLPSTLVGQQAPAMPADTLPGYPQATDDMLRGGQVSLVNFWASWCPPCRAEHPTLTALSEQLPVYGIDLKDPEANALSFLAEDGDPFAALATDPRGRTAIDWGVTAPPETFIVNGNGEILYRHAGPLIREDYENRFLPELERALAAED